MAGLTPMNPRSATSKACRRPRSARIRNCAWSSYLLKKKGPQGPYLAVLTVAGPHTPHVGGARRNFRLLHGFGVVEALRAGHRVGEVERAVAVIRVGRQRR